MKAFGLFLGARILALRQQRRLSRRKLADLLLLNESTVQRWERNGKVPDARAVRDLCVVLNVSADDLLGVSRAR